MVQAIRRYAGGFKITFGVNIHNSMSLPGLAESLVYKFYGDNCAPIYSFADNFAWINKEIRNNLIGGMVMVFKRLIDLGPVDDKYPRAAFYAANGEKYKYLDFQDFNSLYPWAIQSDLPCGPGIVFTKSGSKLKMISMNSSGKKASKESLEWLMFEQARCPDKNMVIHNFYTTGEKKVAGFHVDGYCELLDEDGNIYRVVYEYNGKSKRFP